MEKVFGLFNDSYPPVFDGVTLTVQNYLKYLTAAGRKTCMVTPWNPDTDTSDDTQLFRYFSLGIPSRKPYRYGYPKLDPFIWNRLSKVPFALVHAHCPFSSGRLAHYVAKKQHVPLIATFHSKYKTDLEHSLPSWMVRKIMRRVMDFFDAADEVWIPQAKVEDTVREYGYQGKLTVVENGIDLSMESSVQTQAFKNAARAKLGIKPEVMLLLFVGQHIKEKGVDVIIDSLSLLHDLPVKMAFIGTGYAADEMKLRIHTLGLDKRVQMLGVIESRQQLKNYYAAAHLFLFPSYYDNAPLVVREAAMMGTPAILLKGSTAAEVIVEGTNGFLADNTPESYARIIRSLYGDSETLTRVGRNAAATLTRSWKEVMSEVIARYDEIIQRYGNKK
ncbi:MAG: glycosyltransferase [Muribaculum sp.]|nr:glycosyltransferase [Muribaculaceae bacterium]MCM1080417.1 glycosyltransferase [Muribaculum sp.]